MSSYPRITTLYASNASSRGPLPLTVPAYCFLFVYNERARGSLDMKQRHHT